MSFQSLELAQGVNHTKSIKYRDYFRTRQTVRNTSVMAPPEFRFQYFTAIPFCRLGCQVISERIEMDTVKAETDDATAFLRNLLKELGGADFVNSAHLTAMEFGRSYLVPTGTDREDGMPGVQVIRGMDMVHSIDPYTNEVSEALRVWGPDRTWRVYYTRDETLYLEPSGPNGWAVVNRIPTPNGKIAVFPLVCRAEVNNPWGRPEAKDVFSLQDAACRIATDMAIASATMAVPQRILLGAEEEDFVQRNPDGSPQLNEDGTVKKATAEQLYLSRLLTLSDPTSKVAEFTAAQLQNFTTGLNAITRQAAAVLGVPQPVFGVASDANPASADAQRQDDARLIRRAEQLTRGFDPAWTGLFEYILAADNQFGDQEVTVTWVDPSLPNLATRADSVLKLAGISVGGRPLYDWEELRQMLGDSQEAIDAAKGRAEEQSITSLITQPIPPAPNQVPPGQ